MSYRKKLLLAFVLFALVTNGISLGVMYQLSHHYMFGGYQAKILSIAASVAAMLDGEALKDIQKHEDENTPAYLRLRETLRQARNANQRKDTCIPCCSPMHGNPTERRPPADQRVVFRHLRILHHV